MSDYLKNYAMIIPQGKIEFPKMVEDPNGAPIYRGCGRGPCACTGRCKEIVGHSQNPEDLRKYRERIEQYNKPRPLINYGTFSEPITKDGITKRIWTYEDFNPSNLAEYVKQTLKINNGQNEKG